MGNVQCVSGSYDPELDSVVDSKPVQSRRIACLQGGFEDVGISNVDSGNSFLKVHREDRAQKCILDPREVAKGLIEQAEELIRREKEEEQEDMASLIDEVGEIVRSRTGDESTWGAASSFAPSEYAPSELAPTVATSGSNATQPAGNFDKYGAYGRRTRPTRPNRPPQMKGSGFNIMESIRLEHKVRKVLQIDDEEDMVADGLALQPQVGCRMLPNPFINGTPQDALSQKALEYMSALHLRLKPQNLDCYRKHLLHLKLEGMEFHYRSQGVPIPKPSPIHSQVDIDFGEGPPSLPVHLLVTNSSFMDLAITGSLGLVERPSRAPVVSPGRKFLQSPENFIVMLNRRSGIPLAVCALKAASTGPPVVRIYATKRRVYGQRPAASTAQIGLDWTDSLPLFTWAEIVTEGRYSERLRYSIYMASGSDGRFAEEPSYRAGHDASSLPVIRMVGRTERDDAHSGCACITLSQDADEEPVFNISTSRGIDPALLICFTAFVDEVMEKTMRLQSC